MIDRWSSRRPARWLAAAVLAWLPAVMVVPLAAPAASPGASGLASFVRLVGQWKGTSSAGKSARVSYEVVAGGSAVMERFEMDDHPEMITMYHLDGDVLMLTHYCMAGNQPRMRADSIDGGSIGFDFIDATGLTSAAAGHMHRAVFEFVDPDHLRSKWTWREAGKDVFTEEITLARVPGTQSPVKGR